MSRGKPILDSQTVSRVRAAIKDRAAWFALLYSRACSVIDPREVEQLCRRAIYAYGTYKGQLDGPQLDAAAFLKRFVETGAADLFDAEVTAESGGALNTVGYCALVEAWRELGCNKDQVDLYCDIAMEGDRARAAYHGLDLELGDTIGKGCPTCAIRLKDRSTLPHATEVTPAPSALALVRGALKDRALWFALLYREFRTALPEARLQEIARAAITEFGRMKGAKDPQPFNHADWVRRHRDKGSAEVFDSLVETHHDHSTQRMRACPLVEAWQELGCSPQDVALFCDIAMDGDRGRAAFHRIPFELVHTMPNGHESCLLVVQDRETVEQVAVVERDAHT